ncbi:MAG: hypothetical protein LBE77_11080 [Fluviicola sp.]|nr:hypothetical protein [Fluviicola sp.]
MLLLICCLFCSISKSRADSIPASSRLAIQIAPLALIDFYNGSCYKIGTAVRLTHSLLFSADFGSYFKHFSGIKNNRGFLADFRFKYRFPGKYSGISLSYFYKQQAFDYADFLKPSGTPIVVHTQKYINCFSVNFEQDIPFLKHERAYLTFFGGFGVRFRNAISSLISKHQFDLLQEGGDSQSLYFVLIPGKNIWLNLNLGVRVGFYLF